MKILIVLDDDFQQASSESLLIRKVTMLANGLGASLELLQIVHDPTLELSLFLKKQHLQAARKGLMTDATERTQQLADALEKRGLSVRYDVRWDHPKSAAILRKIEEEQFDWVVKEAKVRSRFLGIFSNTDWELLRQSPIPVYFVKGATPPGAGVVVALEGFTARSGSDKAGLDYDVYRHGRRVAEAFNTPLTLVHAYQPPRDLAAYVGYSALLTDNIPSATVINSLSESQMQLQREIAEEHRAALNAFAEYFSYPVADIVVREGDPDEVIRTEAHLRQAGLVVMGADEKGRLDLLFGGSTAEPTLAEADCDLLFVKPGATPPQESVIPSAEIVSDRSPNNDTAALAKILRDPAQVYDTPDAVVTDKRFTFYERRRILSAWELKLQKEQPAGSVQETEELVSVRKAMQALPQRDL